MSTLYRYLTVFFIRTCFCHAMQWCNFQVLFRLVICYINSNIIYKSQYWLLCYNNSYKGHLYSLDGPSHCCVAGTSPRKWPVLLGWTWDQWWHQLITWINIMAIAGYWSIIQLVLQAVWDISTRPYRGIHNQYHMYHSIHTENISNLCNLAWVGTRGQAGE